MKNETKFLGIGKPITIESRHKRKDGSTYPVELAIAQIETPDGIRFIGVARDITERKRAEEELRQKEAQLSNALKIARAGHWEYDVLNDTFTLNDNFYRIFRTTAEKEGGYKLSSAEYAKRFCYPDDVPIVGKETQAAIETTDPNYQRQLEHRILYADGEVGYMAVRFFITKDEQGRTIKTHGVNQDITEQKHAEEALREREQVFVAISESAQDAIVMIDSDGKVTQWNSAAERIFGYASAEVLGCVLHDFLVPENLRLAHREAFPKFVASGQGAAIGQTLELPGIHKDGTEISLELSLSATRLQDRWCAVGIMRDITERKQAELNLKEAKLLAESANRSKSEFLSNMSHEIRTPLNAVIGFTDLLYSIVTDEKQKSYLHSIQIAGKNLMRLIGDILDLSKIEAGKLIIENNPVNPFEILNEMKQIFEAKISEKMLDFIIEVDSELPTAIVIDETRVRQILLNLIGNAIKFTRKGFIKISVYKDYIQTDHSKIDLVIEVEDTGIGIPEDQLEIIFSSFQQRDGQSNRDYGGTGLGLAITKRLLELMNGEIAVVSEVDKGSTFRVTLRDIPVASTEALGKPNDDSIELGVIHFNGGNVLVVDDVQSNRDLLRELLHRAGLDVTLAVNGKEALSSIEKKKPDLIIMDIRMPVMDGYEATERIKANTETMNIPVIALTASSKDPDEARMENIGFDAALYKPIKPKHLIEILAKYIEYTTVTEGKTTVESHELLSDITPEGIDDFTGFSAVMKEDLFKKWEAIRGAIDMDEVEVFADMLSKLAVDFDIPKLTQYAEKLRHAASAFDIENVDKLIEEFEAIKTKIERIGHG